MKKSKKLLSLLLAFVMVFGVVSSVMVASAADSKNHLAYNETISKKNVDDFVGILDGMIKDLLKTTELAPGFTLDLDAFAAGTYYTNQNALELLRTIGRLLNGITLTTEQVGSMAGSVNNILHSGPWSYYMYIPAAKASVIQQVKDKHDFNDKDAEAYLKTTDAWDDLDFSNIYVDFKDGDREGFLNTIYQGMGSLCFVLSLADNMTGLLTGKGDSNGIYSDTLIPVMQALGVTDYPSTADYKKQIKAGSGAVGKSEAILSPMIVPLVDLLENIAAKPVETLLGMLPNLLYSFEQGRLDGVIGMLEGIEGAGDIIGMIKNADGSINHDIVGLLNGAISGITGTLVPGVEFGLPELKLNWSDIMKKNGTVTVPASLSQAEPQYVIKNSDSSDVFMFVFNYLADALAMEGNQRLIKAVLILLGLDEDTSKMVLEIVTMDRQSLLVTVMGLLGVDGLETPDDKNDPTTDPSKDPNGNGNGGSGSDDAEIPQTGDVALSAFAMLAVAGAAGLVITKKKED